MARVICYSGTSIIDEWAVKDSEVMKYVNICRGLGKGVTTEAMVLGLGPAKRAGPDTGWVLKRSFSE